MPDIFLSYSNKDFERVARLARALQQRGWSVFWDRNTPAGQTWRSWIGRHLREAPCVVVVWTQNSIESEWVIEEAGEAKQRGILIPILLDDVTPPFGFRGIQAARLVDWPSRRDRVEFEVLSSAIEATLNRQKGIANHNSPPENSSENPPKSAATRVLAAGNEPLFDKRKTFVVSAILAALVVLVDLFLFNTTAPSNFGSGDIVIGLSFIIAFIVLLVSVLRLILMLRR